MIEVKVNKKEFEESYPYLGEHKDGSIVFFTGPKEGICVKGDSVTSIGIGSKDWNENSFPPLQGSITLSNA